MQYEVEVGLESSSLIVSWSNFDDYYSLGRKNFISIGSFKYEWFIEYMRREDLPEIIEALQFAYDHGKEESDEVSKLQG